jgi:hypothetical protein
LPSLLDAVIDKGNETGGNNYTKALLDQIARKGMRGYLLSHVCNGIDNVAIANPYVARSNPGTSHFVVENLIRTAHLRDDVGDRCTMTVSDKVK